MYRRTFVGREAELRQLQARLRRGDSRARARWRWSSASRASARPASASSSRPTPTIRGGKTLVGHCYEEGSLSLPYLPFVEAMRCYVLAREPDGARADLGSGAGEVARIVSEVRDRVQVELRRRAGDAEEERWRLLQAVSGFLRNAATVQPLVIDPRRPARRRPRHARSALHLARNLERRPAADRRHLPRRRGRPRASAVRRAGRAAARRQLPARAAARPDGRRGAADDGAASASRRSPGRWRRLVHRQTEGNPLFVQEMLRYLVEEGLVERRGRLAAPRRRRDRWQARIPRGCAT